MQKKVFVDRQAKKTQKRPSYTKLVLCAALALILFAVVAPRLMRKSDQEAGKKPEASKGVVVKEIPKTGLPAEDALPNASQSHSAFKTESETRPSLVSELKPLVGAEKEEPEIPQEKQLGASSGAGLEQKGKELEQRKSVPEGGGISYQSTASDREQTSSSREYDLTSQRQPIVTPRGADLSQLPAPAGKQKESTGASGTSNVVSPSHDKDVAALKAAPSTPPKAAKLDSSGKQLFVVQVGSFKEKQNAEDIKLALEKRGYTVVLKPYVHSKLGQLYTVQLAPVSDIGKANTLMTQIQHESNVKPYVIKVPPMQ